MLHEIGSERRRFFDEQAASWDQREEYTQDQARLARIVPSLGITKGSKVLDVGTGTGIATQALETAVGPAGLIVGIDLSLAMIRKAREVNSRVVRADCHALPFLPRSFDVVFALAVIPHLDSIPQFFEQTATMLSRHGRLIILHCRSREVINDVHRKASPAVESDILPAGDTLSMIGMQNGISQCRYEERDNLFLWMGNYAG
ncbi:MAG: class I SAM-dependent methyltransferase [Calditrichota bacterium]